MSNVRALLLLLIVSAPISGNADPVCSELIAYRDGELFNDWDAARKVYNPRVAKIFAERAKTIENDRRELLEKMDWHMSDWSVIQARVAGSLKLHADIVLQACAYTNPACNKVNTLYGTVSSVVDGATPEALAYGFILGNTPVGGEIIGAVDKANTVKVIAEADMERNKLRRVVAAELARLDYQYRHATDLVRKRKMDYWNAEEIKQSIDSLCGRVPSKPSDLRVWNSNKIGWPTHDRGVSKAP